MGTDLIWYSVTTKDYNGDVYELSANCSAACPSSIEKSAFKEMLENHFQMKLS